MNPVPQASTDKPSFGRSMRMVAWGFLGIRKRSEFQQDLGSVNPMHVVLAGLVGALIFIVVLVGIVKWVVSGA
ncbi:MAG TPA: DUF2970 domain-containing protein [Ottowia sp.]|uniref:DUF2970 domain-containing protein n=1 Tax=Ottowia sp. TaxID=1898956 RepID=UPI002C697BE5|nr:DUF2970 domain-containing protein [Ottowia sp.]HRW71529.1 DUF2970 domain-containing protein [Ottowia sp.]